MRGEADLVLLGAPMYNFGMPAQLKAYVDQIVRVARTFALDVTNKKQPYKPLLTGKRMLVITLTGDAGYQPGGPLEHINHLDPHIRTAFGFIGITDIDFIGVNYDEFPDDRIELLCLERKRRYGGGSGTPRRARLTVNRLPCDECECGSRFSVFRFRFGRVRQGRSHTFNLSRCPISPSRPIAVSPSYCPILQFPLDLAHSYSTYACNQARS